MGEIGRQRIEQRFAWKYSIVNLLAAYERAFEKGGSPEMPGLMQTKLCGRCRVAPPRNPKD